MEAPLYTRSSDRSIESCPAQWHIYTQNLEQYTASWFEIGTALHRAIEDVINEGLDLKQAQGHAAAVVRNRIAEYKQRKPMLWSPNRPESELDELAERLITNWYLDWRVGRRILSNVRWPPRQEVLITLSPDQTPEYLAGMRTQADALFKCRRCKGTVIVDWKTGRGRKSDPLQLQTYRYGLERMGHTMCKCARGWGFFYHLEWRKLQEVDEYDESTVEWMLYDSQALKKMVPVQAIPSWKCDWCLGRSVCPIWADEEDAPVLQTLIDFNASRYDWIEDPTNN